MAICIDWHIDISKNDKASMCGWVISPFYHFCCFRCVSLYMLPLTLVTPASERTISPTGLSFNDAYLLPSYVLHSAFGQLVLIIMVASKFRQARYAIPTGNCSTDAPYTVKNLDKVRCATEGLVQTTCADFNYKNDMNECALFVHKPLFYDFIPGCKGYKAS